MTDFSPHIPFVIFVTNIRWQIPANASSELCEFIVYYTWSYNAKSHKICLHHFHLEEGTSTSPVSLPGRSWDNIISRSQLFLDVILGSEETNIIKQCHELSQYMTKEKSSESFGRKVKTKMICGLVPPWKRGNGEAHTSWEASRLENMFWTGELPTQTQPIIMMLFHQLFIIGNHYWGSTNAYWSRGPKNWSEVKGWHDSCHEYWSRVREELIGADIYQGCRCPFCVYPKLGGAVVSTFMAVFIPQHFLEKYCQHKYLHWNLLQIEKEYRWRLRAKVST